jgi:kumamolisin
MAKGKAKRLVSKPKNRSSAATRAKNASQRSKLASHLSTHAVLPGSRRSLAAGSRMLGTANEDELIEVTVKLRRKAPLPPLTSRPAVPLTRSEAAAKFGATPADVAKVTKILEGYGLTVVRTDEATRSIDLRGPIRAIQKAFQVKLFRYAYEHGQYRGRSGLIHVPAELDGLIVGVYGLDNRRVIRRRRRWASSESALAATTATTMHRGFFPSDLAKLYDFPHGDGAGQSIGILEFGGGFLPDDLELFCEKVGVPVPNVVPISVDHAGTNADDAAAVEVMLDIEVIAGVCPKAKIPVYFGPDLSERSLIDTVSRAIHDEDNNPFVLSISWGNFEESTSWSDGTLDRINDAFHEAALMGVTICIASGDDGSDDGAGDGLAHVDFPASSPFVLAVGGTDLRVRPGTNTERVWKDGDGRRPVIGGTGGSTGGGVSSHFLRPVFQAHIEIAPVNPGAHSGRVVPDVAAHAQTDQKHTGYFQVTDQKVFLDGGTSAAAPLWAALIGLLNAELQSRKGGDARVGYLTPVLYQAGADGKPVGAGACRDIVVGDNISAAVGGYHAGPGYDAVTGWGSPIGSKLLEGLLAVI